MAGGQGTDGLYKMPGGDVAGDGHPWKVDCDTPVRSYETGIQRLKLDEC